MLHRVEALASAGQCVVRLLAVALAGIFSVGSLDAEVYPGDCDGSAEVPIEELVRVVNIAPGAASLEACAVADQDGDGQVTIEEVILAVNIALYRCVSAGLSPTPKPTAATVVTPTRSSATSSSPHTYVQLVRGDSVVVRKRIDGNCYRCWRRWVDLYLSVNGAPEAAAQVTLSGSGGTAVIPFQRQTTFDGRFVSQL